jgi:hypothetical protein
MKTSVKRSASKTAKKKKEYRPDEVFRRTPSGKYHPIGYDFRGFPMDGIWLVANGKSNMSCLISLKERVPVFALNYRQHELALCQHIQAKFREGNLSLMDEARLCCDYFAEIAAKQVEARK